MNPGDLRQMVTHHGTIIFLDSATMTLRHGPAASSPCNVALAIIGDTGRLVLEEVGEEDCALRILPGLVGRVERAALLAKDVHCCYDLVPGEQESVGLLADGLFLCAEPDGRVSISREQLGLWELFRLVETMRTDRTASNPVWRRKSVSGELVHISVGYPRNGMMDMLEESSRMNGCHFVGLPKYWRAGPFWMPNKITLLKSYLDAGEIDLDTIVLSTDAYDVLIAEHAGAIVEKFRAARADLLMGAEASFHPADGRDAVMSQFDGLSRSKWRYVNGGGFIGYGWAVRDLADFVQRRLDEEDYDYHKPDDQALQQRFFLTSRATGKPRVRLDTECSIFCCLNTSTDDFAVSKSRVRHIGSQQAVSVLHANGGKHNLDIITRYWSLIGGKARRAHDLYIATIDGSALAFDRAQRKLVLARPFDPATVFLLAKGDRHAIAVNAEHGLLTFDPYGGIDSGATMINSYELLECRGEATTCHGTALAAYCSPSLAATVVLRPPTLSHLLHPWFDSIVKYLNEFSNRY